MTDIVLDVSGQMEAPVGLTQKTTLPSFLRVPTEMPDPKEWIQRQRQNVRPWLVFVQTSNFKPPPSIPRLGKRIMKNVEYFQSNYLFVFIGLVIYCLVTSPLLLLALAGSFYAGYKLNQRHQQHNRLVILGKELTLAQQYGLVALCSLPVYYLVGAHGVIFWVIGASMVIITLHASFYNIDALATRNDDEFPLMEEV